MKRLSALGRYIPTILAVWGVAFGAFFYGYLVGDRHWFPYHALDGARVAGWIVHFKLNNNRIRELGAFTEFTPEDGMKRRIVSEEPVNDDANLLFTGGEGQYLEYCPEHGCAAVILKRDGSLVHAYPYRPEELATKRTFELPYQEIMHDDAKDTAVFGLAALPHGDLIVVYDYEGTWPVGGGIARLDKDGHVIWYRRDYTDHWPTIDANGDILTISHTLEGEHVDIDLAHRKKFSFDCAQGLLGDVIRVLDADGEMKEEIPIFDMLRASPYRSYLLTSIDIVEQAKNACDPLHTNMVMPVGPALAARLQGVAADDLLLSFHNISSLAVVGRHEHTIKYLFRGSFLFQHSAQLTREGDIVLFDNAGGSPAGGPSRLLRLDPTSGKEQTLFPSEDTPAEFPFFSQVKGNINISADGERALVAATEIGRTYEIRLKDGALLTSFDNLHDVHTLPQFADKKTLVRFSQHGVYYVSPHLLD